VHLCQARWLAHVGGGGSGPCVVDSNVTVVPGSVIDCETLDVHVTAANTSLTVQDGHFVLKANGLLVTGQGRKVLATCSGVAGKHGFRVQGLRAVSVHESPARGQRGRRRVDRAPHVPDQCIQSAPCCGQPEALGIAPNAHCCKVGPTNGICCHNPPGEDIATQTLSRVSCD
jgi:hypothetical protein